MVVAAHQLQTDPRFGTDDDSKVTGKAVKPRKYGKPWSPFPSLNPLELEVGQAYIVTKQTPLMPSHSPADPIAALQKMKQIPEGGGFKVHDTFDKKGNPWYRVSAFDQRKKQIETGWINSTALLGQQLKAYK